MTDFVRDARGGGCAVGKPPNNLGFRLVREALARRNDWLARHFGDVTETLSKVVITSADIESLQRLVESDLSLVHAAYYIEEDCIARIAAWISGANADELPADQSVPTAMIGANGRMVDNRHTGKPWEQLA